MPIRLALSLHAPEDALRSQIMPVNERYSLAEVLEACRRLLRARKRRKVFIEYVMLAGVNDRYEQAVPLAQLLDPRDLQGQPDPLQPDRLGLRRLVARRDRRLPRRAGGARRCARPCASRAGATSTPPAASWRRRASGVEASMWSRSGRAALRRSLNSPAVSIRTGSMSCRTRWRSVVPAPVERQPPCAVDRAVAGDQATRRTPRSRGPAVVAGAASGWWQHLAVGPSPPSAWRSSSSAGGSARR